MLGTFGSLKASLPLGKKLTEPHTEGFVNRLHYRASVLLLFGCSLIVTCLEWVGNGNKINCVLTGPVDNWIIPQNVINTYCYVLTTFTLPRHYASRIGDEVVQPGVGNFNPASDDVSFKAYYQWVPFVLFLQGCCFYFPHLVFKAWEGGKVKNIIAGLNNLILNKDERSGKERILANYFVESLHTHNFWAMKMLIIEFLNLLNVVGQIYFVDVFLGGEFSTFGMNAINFLDADPENRIDPMATVFPRVTKCTYRKYGPSGTIQNHDAMCVMPINIVNEKIYVFLWFWLILMSALSVFSLIHHIFMMVTPSVNKMVLRSRSMNQADLPLEEMGREFELGDWKLLMLLSRNMEPLVFGEFIRELFQAMKDANANANAAAANPKREKQPLIA